MALPATDSFTTGSDQRLEVYNATNWDELQGLFTVFASTDTVASEYGTTDHFARWIGDTFNDDHYSQVTYTSLGAGGFDGPACRVPSSGITGYMLQCWNNGMGMYVYVAGSATALGSAGSAPSIGATIRLEVEGTTIRPKVNGTVVSPPGAQTNSSLTTGAAGLSGYGSIGGGGTQMDNWEGGNLGAAAAASFILRRKRAWRGYR